MYEARIYITLKESVLDPQGQAVLSSLHQTGHNSVNDVRIGKYIELKLDAESKSAASQAVTKYCDELLVNQVIETYRFDLLETARR
ncbi:MAG: phosphoribosylformylglycinamidine synthase subunit PurS [Leptonema sp. (in: Bacteria)]|nr:phosphoribosylformylglycinamidine synthase subunit PurS [Leptonema sp. (in: bacteria)]